MSTINLPVIGIIGKYTVENTINPHFTSCMIRQEILNAVLDHNAIPIGITLTRHALNAHDREVLTSQISCCDGLIFQGGKTTVDFEYEAAQLSYTKNIPTLGFCMGQTIMAHIDDSVQFVDVDPYIHDLPGKDHAHPAYVVPGTLFHHIVGTAELEVNSRHNRAIATCSRLKISATDCDGNAEVIEAPDRNFYLATLFHPESTYQTDRVMDKIFRAFIEASIQYSKTKSPGAI